MKNDIKLLIVCQKVDSDDDLLGFFHGWIEEFAKHCEQVTVICLYRGEYELRRNVKVLSLGKEDTTKKLLNCCIVKLLYFVRFFKYIWLERNNYDIVFVHMNHEYVVLGGWLWKLLSKKIVLWHAHKSVNWKLRFSEKLVDFIVTSTASGCRLNSKKIRIVGQGIDVQKYSIHNIQYPINKEFFKIITIGRISPIKDYETLINAVGIVKLSVTISRLVVEIIGGVAVKKDEAYLEKLKTTIEEKGLEEIFKFIGPVANKDIAAYLETADLFVNTSLTGSLDKAVLEAMAAGLPILTCNEAYLDVLGDYKEKLMFAKGDSRNLADKISYIMNLNKGAKEKMTSDLRDIVVKNHNLKKLVLNILNYY